jgi:hypothetical protein
MMELGATAVDVIVAVVVTVIGLENEEVVELK